MKQAFSKRIFGFMVLGLFGSILACSQGSVKITQPTNGATVSNPVKICMKVYGVEVEPAKNGVNEGKGHHHLLVDTNLPTTFTDPIPKDEQHIHMGDGSTCKELELEPGEHTVRTLFAKGDHVPYVPPITDAVKFTVE